MKRTAEIILTVIGLLFSLLGTVMTGIMMSLAKSDAFTESFVNEFNQSAMEGGEAVEPGDATMVLNILTSFGWLIFIVCLLGVILGGIAIYFYAGNKKPKAAGIMLIITAIVVGVGTIFFGFVPALLYLIAGIIGLVRKTPPEPTEADTILE